MHELIPANELRSLKVFNISSRSHRTFIAYALTKYHHLDEFMYKDKSTNTINNPVSQFIVTSGLNLTKLVVKLEQKTLQVVDSVVNSTPRLDSLGIQR
jgi:hypothetical protein